MPVLDWVFLAVLLISLVVGAWRGLIYELLSVLSWIAAFILAQWLGPEVGQWLPMSGAEEAIRSVAGFVVVFILMVFVGGFIAWLVKKLVQAVGLRAADRALGAMFGLVRGVILLLAATVVVGMTPMQTSGWWQESWGAAGSTATLRGLKPMLPQEFGQYLP